MFQQCSYIWLKFKYSICSTYSKSISTDKESRYHHDWHFLLFKLFMKPPFYSSDLLPNLYTTIPFFPPFPHKDCGRWLTDIHPRRVTLCLVTFSWSNLTGPLPSTTQMKNKTTHTFINSMGFPKWIHKSRIRVSGRSHFIFKSSEVWPLLSQVPISTLRISLLWLF